MGWRYNCVESFSSQSYCGFFGEILFIERTSYRPWHFDLEESDKSGDMLGCTLRGRKLWMFCELSRFGGELVRHCGQMSSKVAQLTKYLSRSPRQQKKVWWCVAEPGEVIYMPYGMAHSVVTLCEDGPSALLTIEFVARPERGQKINGSAHLFTSVGCRK